MGMGTGWISTTDNILETTEIFGCPTDNVPEITEKGSMVITRKKTSTTHKNKIMKKKTNERTNIYLKFYFKIMFLSHNNVVFEVKIKNSYK